MSSLAKGSFEATGTLELLKSQTVREVTTASTKKEGREMVAQVLLARLDIHD